jgi:hypothetical protein
MRHACIAAFPHNRRGAITLPRTIVPVSLDRQHGRKNSTSNDEIPHAAAKRRIPEHG